MRIPYKFLCTLIILGCVTSLTALAPAGRVLPPIDSGTNTTIDNQYKDNFRNRYDGDRKHRHGTRVINQYYYPYYSYPYYTYPSGYGYSSGYYGGGYPYQPHNAFPDDAAADELFRQLSE